MRPAPKSSPEAVSRRPDGRGARTVGRCPVRGPGNARAGWRGAGVRPGAGAAVSRRGWALFLAMSLIWGVPYLLIKVAVEDLPPVVVVFGRCVLGAALLLPWTVARGGLRPALRRWRPLLAFTALEMTGPWLLLAYAEQTLSSSLTGLLVAAVPFVAALAGWLAGEEERLTRVRLLGMGLGVAGIGVLLGLDVEGLAPLPLLAVALVVVGYAAARAPADALLAVLVLGLVCTALALALFFALIREVGPQRALVITFLNPAVAGLLGVLRLDGPFTLGLAGGRPVVVLGCVLATRRGPAHRTPAELGDVDAA